MKNKIKIYKKRVFENSTVYTISIRYGVAHTSLQKNNIRFTRRKPKEMVDMINIQLIEELRMQYGYTQEQLAIKLGYNSKATYNLKIKGSRQFSVEDIVNICKVFQLEPNDLINLEKEGK